MRFGLWGLAALFLGAFGAHFLLQDRGYVLISFRSYVVEMSVPALLAALVLVYALVRLLVRIWRAPRELGHAVAERRLKRASSRLTSGLIHLTEGDFGRGERLLTQGLKGSEAPLVNYLMAARAAQSQGSRERRNEWLQLAYEELPEAEAAILLTQAELQLESGELERALATLQKVLESRPEHRVALGLLARAYRALGDQARLLELLPRLGRAELAPGVLEAIAVEALEAAAASAELGRARLDELWQQLPPALRKTPRMLRAYALALEQQGQGARAEKLLRGALKKHWHEALVTAYGQVRGEDAAKQLARAEQWLKQQPEDAALLLTAARLCMSNELWGKARSYLESSLAVKPEPKAYALYGQLLDQLGEQDKAALAYHSGLSLVSGGRADQPALVAPRPPQQAAEKRG